MPDTVRLYFDAAVAVATMATLGVISGFVTFAATGERMLAFLAATAAFVLTGIVLAVRGAYSSKSAGPPEEPPG